MGVQYHYHLFWRSSRTKRSEEKPKQLNERVFIPECFCCFLTSALFIWCFPHLVGKGTWADFPQRLEGSSGSSLLFTEVSSQLQRIPHLGRGRPNSSSEGGSSSSLISQSVLVWILWILSFQIFHESFMSLSCQYQRESSWAMGCFGPFAANTASFNGRHPH